MDEASGSCPCDDRDRRDRVPGVGRCSRQGRRAEDQRDGRVGPPRRRHEHHRTLRCLAPALRRPLRDHHGHARRGRRQRGRHRDRAGARPPARERGPHRPLPVRHRRHLQHRPRRLLLQHERAADPVLLGPGRDAAPDHADHPHDEARHLHRLHADARRRPRQPSAGRPLHLGGRARRGRPDDVPRAADGAERAQHVAGQEDLLRREHRRHRRHDHLGRLHDRLRSERDQQRHGRRRLDGLRLAVPLAARKRPGRGRPARRRSGRRSPPRAPRPTRRRAA